MSFYFHNFSSIAQVGTGLQPDTPYSCHGPALRAFANSNPKCDSLEHTSMLAACKIQGSIRPANILKNLTCRRPLMKFACAGDGTNSMSTNPLISMAICWGLARVARTSACWAKARIQGG